MLTSPPLRDCTNSPTSPGSLDAVTAAGSRTEITGGMTPMSSKASAFSIAALMQDREQSHGGNRKRRLDSDSPQPDVQGIVPARRSCRVKDEDGSDCNVFDDEDNVGETVETTSGGATVTAHCSWNATGRMKSRPSDHADFSDVVRQCDQKSIIEDNHAVTGALDEQSRPLLANSSGQQLPPATGDEDSYTRWPAASRGRPTSPSSHPPPRQCSRMSICSSDDDRESPYSRDTDCASHEHRSRHQTTTADVDYCETTPSSSPTSAILTSTGGSSAATTTSSLNSSSNDSPLLAGVTCRLETKELWDKFYELGTEMIITKSGRQERDGSKLLHAINGCSQKAAFTCCTVWLSSVDNKRYRYAYHRSSWLVAGKADPPLPTRLYVHPDSPFTADQLAKQTVSFEKIKLTNNMLDKSGHIILNSMHKYQPRVRLVLKRDVKSNSPSCLCLSEEHHKTFVFPETVFIAVTAYQNQLITRLKIDSNPFAKGFRDSSRLSDLERESMGAPPSLFYNIPCRENIESLLHHHLASAGGGYPPSSASLSPNNFCSDADLDDAIKTQFTNVRHQGDILHATLPMDKQQDQPERMSAVDFLTASMAFRRAPILSRLAAAAAAGPAAMHPATAAAAYNFLAAAAVADKSLYSLYGGLLRMPTAANQAGHNAPVSAAAAAAASVAVLPPMPPHPNGPAHLFAAAHHSVLPVTVPSAAAVRPAMAIFPPGAAAVAAAAAAAMLYGGGGYHSQHPTCIAAAGGSPHLLLPTGVAGAGCSDKGPDVPRASSPNGDDLNGDTAISGDGRISAAGGNQHGHVLGGCRPSYQMPTASSCSGN